MKACALRPSAAAPALLVVAISSAMAYGQTAEPLAGSSPASSTASSTTADVAARPIVADGATLKLEGITSFLEGPAWHPNGNVYFSDCENNRILRRDVTGKIHIYRTPSGRANGLMFNAERRLIACEGAGEGGNRRVTRTEANGVVTVRADRDKGKRLNAPNDLTIDSRGRIYFTDPRYGDRDGLEMFAADGKPVFGVYRIDVRPDGECEMTQILSSEVACPNGIEVSPGDRYLYVVDNDNSRPDGNRKIWRFELSAEGAVVPKSRTMLFDFGRGRGGDGLALDAAGRLYVAAGTNLANPPVETDEFKAGVYVLSPEGKLLHTIPVPEDMVTNCTFGGADLKTLFVTAGHTLFSIPVTTPGYVPWSLKHSHAKE